MTSVEKTPRALFADSPRRWVRLSPWMVASLLFAALLTASIHTLTVDLSLHAAVASALAIAQTAPLLLAVVRPVPAWIMVFTADVVGALVLLTVDLGPDDVWPFPPALIVGYIGLCLALGLRERRRVLFVVWLVTAGTNLALGFVAPHGWNDQVALITVFSGIALLVGGTLRERFEAQRRLAEQETISEAERDRRTLLEERARIARELHDVVAHHMSVITVQADTATYRLGDLRPDVQDEFTSIAATARDSLAEMRRLLGLLRNEDAEGELTPQPGLDRIGQLVAATVRAGVPVELTLDDADVPEAEGLAAYRVVQESLANVVRHAPGTPTQVSVSHDGERLTVVVVNASPAHPAARPLETVGTGHGLVGMRERVRLLGGTLDAGPLPDGGFRVAAQLPMTGRNLA